MIAAWLVLVAAAPAIPPPACPVAWLDRAALAGMLAVDTASRTLVAVELEVVDGATRCPDPVDALSMTLTLPGETNPRVERVVLDDVPLPDRTRVLALAIQGVLDRPPPPLAAAPSVELTAVVAVRGPRPEAAPWGASLRAARWLGMHRVGLEAAVRWDQGVETELQTVEVGATYLVAWVGERVRVGGGAALLGGVARLASRSADSLEHTTALALLGLGLRGELSVALGPRLFVLAEVETRLQLVGVEGLAASGFAQVGARTLAAGAGLGLGIRL